MAGQKENPVITGDMKNNVDRASILIESLPYIRKMRGQTFVIKYGGNAMINEELKQSVMDDITLLKYIGINPVIVHGGGPDISDMLNKVNKESHFVNGLRYTDEETMGYPTRRLTPCASSATTHQARWALPSPRSAQHAVPR